VPSARNAEMCEDTHSTVGLQTGNQQLRTASAALQERLGQTLGHTE
jgi:FtsZ-binding cell division protein ZapB